MALNRWSANDQSLVPEAGLSDATRYLTWHLLPHECPDLGAVVGRNQSVVTGVDGLDPVPPQWLHLTVQGVGFADEVIADRYSARFGAGTRSMFC